MENRTAKEIMNREVLTVNAELSLQGLAEFLFQNSISGAPVTSGNGKLVGVVSITDIIRHETLLEKGLQFNSRHDFYFHRVEKRFSHQDLDSLHLGDESLVTVKDIMTPTILEVKEEDTVQQVADTMIKNRIHRVIVTHEKKPIGIISTADMMKVIRDM
jgi:CBS domain-containing protein